MPRLQEPVWDAEGVFLPEPPLSDSSEMSEGFRRLYLEPDSILALPSEPPLGLFTSSPDQAWCTAAEAERFSASVTGWRTHGPPSGQVHYCRRTLVFVLESRRHRAVRNVARIYAAIRS